MLLSAVQAVVHLITGEALLHVGRDQLLFLYTWCLTLLPSIVWVKANADCGFVLRYVRIGRVDVLALRMLAILLKCVSCYRFRYLLTYIHTYLFIYIHTYIFIYLHTYIHIYLFTYIHTYLFIYIHTYIFIYLHTYILIYLLTYIHTYLLKYIHTYLRTYIHT